MASSKIEHVNAGWRQLGLAIAGVKAGSEAKSQLAAVQALATMIAAADTGTITAADLLSAHRQLMEATSPRHARPEPSARSRTGSAGPTTHRAAHCSCHHLRSWCSASSMT
ncbi:hypothetical protein [Rhodococcus sp. BS-15]|uniref:hypothetical protein n=1 Tax=Rhodococcus sp. BS-15 TaxID=1304954 RepID=UPI000AB0143D|nr:hypothetical protein [Rhodococcus sp. BS-15]